MTRLFTYCIFVDDGAAPNPFWGVCTLAICKPAIRRAAQVGDWVAATGSVESPIGNIAGHLVYAMRVTRTMTLEQYDHYARTSLPNKIPKWFEKDIRLRLGDAIYDFASSPPSLRRSVHNERNRERDLSGKNVLLSSHFYYFGDHPVRLPEDLLPIVRQGRGHRSSANDPYVTPFVEWLTGLGRQSNHLYGCPQYRIFKGEIITQNQECAA